MLFGKLEWKLPPVSFTNGPSFLLTGSARYPRLFRSAEIFCSLSQRIHNCTVRRRRTNVESFHEECHGMGYTLLEKFWRISLYVTDDAIVELYVTLSL